MRFAIKNTIGLGETDTMSDQMSLVASPATYAFPMDGIGFYSRHWVIALDILRVDDQGTLPTNYCT